MYNYQLYILLLRSTSLYLLLYSQRFGRCSPTLAFFQCQLIKEFVKQYLFACQFIFRSLGLVVLKDNTFLFNGRNAQVQQIRITPEGMN